MTISEKQLIPPKQAENAQNMQYTAINCTAKITKFTATNTSGANVTLSVNVVTSGDTPGNQNLVMKTRTIAPNETYTCPELVGHGIGNNGYISTLASAASAITIMCTGYETT